MPIATVRGEAELVDLRSRAEALALERRERVSSAHLLVAMADVSGMAAELLRERRLTRESLLKAARTASDDETDPIRASVQRAREVMRSLRASEPSAVHLLVALLSVRRGAAYRALDQLGVDVARLRTAAVNAGLRAAGRSTEPTTPSGLTPLPSGTTPIGSEVEARRAPVRAVSVPLMPPSGRPTQPRLPVQAVVAAEPSRVIGPSERNPSNAAPAVGTRKAKRRVKKPATQLDPKRFRWLASFIAEAAERSSETSTATALVGRELEIERVLDVLAKREGNNPCLVGPSGVGKSAVARAVQRRFGGQWLAESVEANAANPDDFLVVEVSLGSLLSGASLRGAIAQRFVEIKKEISELGGRVVLYFDDLAQLFGPESSEELVGEVKRALGCGEMRCFGTASAQEYERVIEASPQLNRVFTRIDVEEPSLATAREIVEAVTLRFAAHHQLQFQLDALHDAVSWSQRYISGRALPEKALSVVDLAGAKARRRGQSLVTRAHVADVVSETAQVPTERLLESDAERMLRLEATLAESVVGHAPALTRIASILRRNAAGLAGQRPIGTFLLLGPTGVGKTETAKAIARALFGSATAMTRLDMSEYSEAHAVARLIGAPPGYVGHEAGGQLTSAVRRRPYQVLLLDEIEKAHEEVLETFLSVLDEGRLTDGRGKTVDFTNTVIVLTSNLGARESARGAQRLGFAQRGTTSRAPSGADERVIAAAREHLAPEFFNRLDEVLVFGALSEDEVSEIAQRLLERLAETVRGQRRIELQFDSSVVRCLLSEGGYDVSLGARPMKRAIARLVEAPLAEALLAGRFNAGDVVNVEVEAGCIRFARRAGQWAAAE